jgi:hypothetical protein
MAAPGQVEDSRAAEVRLHIQGTAVPQLHRQPPQPRLKQVGVLPGFRPGRKTRKPLEHRRRQLAGNNPAHLQAVDRPSGRVLSRRSRQSFPLVWVLPAARVVAPTYHGRPAT